MEISKKKGKITDNYEVGLMAVSIVIVLAIVAGLSIWPEKGKEVTANLMYFLTHTFGFVMQLLAGVMFVFLVVLAISKYGNIRFGKEKPDFSTKSWVSMMFFTGLGAGTVYWAFLEWGWHYQCAPGLHGTAISDAYKYEQSLTYTLFDWGPMAWALLCIFVLPFAYHYYIKKDEELRMSALCKYTVGEKAVKGWFGKIVNFLFIFAAVGSICITAGSSASTIAAAIADLFGFNTSFTLMVIVLIGSAVLYTISSLIGLEKGMRKISDWNVYFCIILLLFILIAGNTQYILDSLTNSLGLLVQEFPRMALFTDPAAKSGYPQDWTVFYLVYWLVFGPFTGLFVAKISRGRTIKEIIINMLITGSLGCIAFFGIITAYQEDLTMKGILNVPQMLADGKAEFIATETINSLPLGKVAMVLYLLVILLFLATTLDATSFTLSTTISKKLKIGDEPGKGMKFAWCLVLVAIPVAIAYAGTDITTIKSIVIATGLPLLIILGIIYHGFLKEMVKDHGRLSREEIIDMYRLDDVDEKDPKEAASVN